MIAHHYGAALEFAGAAGIDTLEIAERARRAFREAGDRAAALNGFAAAEQWYGSALELWPESGSDRARLLLARSGVRLWAAADAVADAEEAAALFRESGDPSGAGEAE